MCRDFLSHDRCGTPTLLTNSRAQSRRIDRFKGAFRLRLAHRQPLTTERGLIWALRFAFRCHIWRMSVSVTHGAKELETVVAQPVRLAPATLNPRLGSTEFNVYCS